MIPPALEKETKGHLRWNHGIQSLTGRRRCPPQETPNDVPGRKRLVGSVIYQRRFVGTLCPCRLRRTLRPRRLDASSLGFREVHPRQRPVVLNTHGTRQTTMARRRTIRPYPFVVLELNQFLA